MVASSQGWSNQLGSGGYVVSIVKEIAIRDAMIDLITKDQPLSGDNLNRALEEAGWILVRQERWDAELDKSLQYDELRADIRTALQKVGW